MQSIEPDHDTPYCPSWLSQACTYRADRQYEDILLVMFAQWNLALPRP